MFRCLPCFGRSAARTLTTTTGISVRSLSDTGAIGLKSTSSKMVFEKFQGLELPATADMHVHLRDGKMMELVVPTIRRGGCDMVMVMVCASPVANFWSHNSIN
jgi:dihydroorotase-like cyclic amidohydrolase